MQKTFKLFFITLISIVASLGLSAEESPNNDLSRKVMIEKTLAEARQHLERNDFRQAVGLLERNLGIINGDKIYLENLRIGYIGLLKQVEGGDQQFEKATYQRRLSFIDPLFKADSPASTILKESIKPNSNHSWDRNNVHIPEIQVGDIQIQPRLTNKTDPAIQRAKLNETQFDLNDNPFSWTNSQQRWDSYQYKNKADSDFAKGEYASAARYYSLAWQNDPVVDSSFQERWAYSRLYTISERYPHSSSPEKIDKELSAIGAMAPKLLPQIAALKSNFNIKKSEIIDDQLVSHSVTNGWNTAFTESFKIHHHLQKADVEKLARLLESTKANQTQKWFGLVNEPWNPPCDVVIHKTASQYSSATGAPSTSPGHSTIKIESGRIVLRRIDLHSDDPNMAIGVIPHEATHIVLAGKFGQHLVPRWADEGMSVLSEPEDRVARHTNDLKRLAGKTGFFSIRTLMNQQDYPESKLMGTFYSQSVSVVQFLASIKGPRAFTAFLKDGLDLGYDRALERNYSISWEQLDSMWREKEIQKAANITALK